MGSALAHSGSGSAQLTIRGPIIASSYACGVTLAALSRLDGTLSVVFEGSPSQETIDSIRSTIFGPVLWPHATPRDITIRCRDIRVRQPIGSRKDGLFCAPTSALRNDHPEAFVADLSKLLISSGIVLPRSALTTIGAIAFEASSNAEEYGCISSAQEGGETFRLISARVTNSQSQLDSPHFPEYFLRYVEEGHAQDEQWVELIVIDAGVGIAYPRHFVLAKDSGWESADLYSKKVVVERLHMQQVLDDVTSTKGLWGRVINRHTAVGQGTRFIKFRLAMSRGFAMVRSGRLAARFYYAKATATSGDFNSLPPYEIGQIEYPLFLGTAWQVIVPLKAQYGLPV